MLLDEPTRGMDRAHKDALAARHRASSRRRRGVIVATHDTEFAAAFADRVVLMGQGEVIADGPPHEVLGGGWHFATDVARATRRRRAAARRAARALLARGAGADELAVASFLVLLAVVLGAGFAWYERTRPPARVLALVAALAALAVVGRLAFAPIPNVKPTTDIVLFAGYALGPRARASRSARSPRSCRTSSSARARGRPGRWWPGAASAWPARCVARAVAGARALAHRAGRSSCGLAGLAFGAFMDVYQWSFTYSNDPGSYLVVASTSLPYNLAHAIGNVVFCLLIGPAFIRALRRYRRRFEVRWAVPGRSRCC